MLERSLKELFALGFEVKIGLEIEFTVFKDAKTLEPLEYNGDSNLHSLVNNIDDFDIIYKKLQENDI